MSVDQKSSSEHAYRVTKEQILTGQARGGQLLSEVETAARLGVSRTPVHEAFLRLAAEDLLELQPRRGAVVIPASVQDASDLLEMRLALETAAVRRVCRTPATAESLFDELTELVTRQREVAAARDHERFAAADDAFHRRIVDVAGNAIGRRFYGSLSDRQRRMMADAAQRDSARLASMTDEHEHLAAAILARDVHAFETALLAHLESTYRVVLG
ncbi:GntR family transcriptional regulator [Mycolicibacterium madagascariense]|uniref:GntR family transcriptional regulator n=1 Tax=Mycolicibacterium madagascariense TaxID=212765 RepID=A0A7I7XAP2_9MYCO|nr:GntR family transcriptional regulator [Mycolicibacterium madagascariense]MCV7013472.1 GntR family transcriptional regulator [Mycolicibacterium madagascariense]BBZ26013.1 GntR family transcriptional regulator [Mycolicibacterium madagascariense]